MTVESMFKIMDQYGLGALLAGLLVWAVAYVLRRMFNAKDGIITRAGERHVQFIDETATVQKEIAAAITKIAETASSTEKTITSISNQCSDGVAATVRIINSGVHGCDIVEKVCKSLNIIEETKSSIDAIRRELTGQATA